MKQGKREKTMGSSERLRASELDPKGARCTEVYTWILWHCCVCVLHCMDPNANLVCSSPNGPSCAGYSQSQNSRGP